MTLIVPASDCAYRLLSLKTVQRLANRVAELSTALSHVRVMHTPGPDGLCPICHVAGCATALAAVDPRPLRTRRWIPIPRGDEAA